MNIFKKKAKKMSSRAVVSITVFSVLAVILALTLVACQETPATTPTTTPGATGTIPSGTIPGSSTPGAPDSTYYSPSSVSVDG